MAIRNKNLEIFWSIILLDNITIIMMSRLKRTNIDGPIELFITGLTVSYVT